MSRFTPGLFSLLIAAVLVACNEETPHFPDSESGITAAPSAPTTAPVDSSLARVLFIRGNTGDRHPLEGEIWVSGLSGTGARRVTPEGVAADYIGLGNSKSGGSLLYYATQDGGANTTLYAIDLDGGDGIALLSYPDLPNYYFADISPDGRYLVHTQPLGLDMFDVATGRSVTLFDAGSGPDCLAGAIDECYRAIAPDWSPDGRLLKVVHSVYEGGWAEVLDPFQTPVAVFTSGDRSYPRQTAWSPASDAICAHGVGLADPSGLYLLEAPDWEARNLFPEFEDYTANPDGRQVVGCDWASADTVAFLTMVEQPQRRGELHLFDRAMGQSKLVATLPDATGCCDGIIAAVPGDTSVLVQLLQDEGGTSFVWSQPALVDVGVGTITHVLEKGDVVLEVFSP